MEIFTLTICDIQRVGFGSPIVLNFTDNAMAFKVMEEKFIEMAHSYGFTDTEIEKATNEEIKGLSFAPCYCYLDCVWYADITSTELCEQVYDPLPDEIKARLNKIYVNGKFKNWKIKVNEVKEFGYDMTLYNITNLNDGDNFFFITKGKETFICCNTAAVANKGINEYLYKRYNENGLFIENIGLDSCFNIITEKEFEELSKCIAIVGYDFAPNYEHKNRKDGRPDPFGTENIQEFTLQFYELYKEHIDKRDVFLEWVAELADKFAEIYKYTDFSLGVGSYYDYVDFFIDIHAKEAKESCWYC